MKKEWHLFGLIFFIGFSSLVYEIYGTRVLFFFFTETDWAITVGITAFLAGIAFSSLFFSSLSQKRLNSLMIIWIMQMAAGIYGYLFLQHYIFIPQLNDKIMLYVSSPLLVAIFKIVLMWLFLFVPAFFIGGSFPLINGLIVSNRRQNTTGLLYFWDTIGSLVGGVVTGFILLPYYGFSFTCLLASGINFVLAILIGPKLVLRIIPAVFLACIILISFRSGKSEFRNYLTEPSLSVRFGTILFQKISPYGVVTIGNNVFGSQGLKGLFINYRGMCLSPSHESESSLGRLATQELPFDSRVLNIGLGCGFTAQSIALQSNVKYLDIVEINPVVVEATEQFFKKDNGDVTHSPKTNLIVEDGAVFIQRTKNKYNAVVVDIEEPTIITSSPLFTSEYIGMIHNILLPDGILAFWIIAGNDNMNKVLYNTLKANFAFVYTRKIAGRFFTFYATDQKRTALQPVTIEENKEVERILKVKNFEINSLDHRVLEKFFDLNNAFNLPKNYQDPQAKLPISY